MIKCLREGRNPNNLKDGLNHTEPKQTYHESEVHIHCKAYSLFSIYKSIQQSSWSLWVDFEYLLNISDEKLAKDKAGPNDVDEKRDVGAPSWQQVIRKQNQRKPKTDTEHQTIPNKLAPEAGINTKNKPTQKTEQK